MKWIGRKTLDENPLDENRAHDPTHLYCSHEPKPLMLLLDAIEIKTYCESTTKYSNFFVVLFQEFVCADYD